MYVNCSQAQFAVPLNYSQYDGHNCFILLDNDLHSPHDHKKKKISFQMVLLKYYNVSIIRIVLEKPYRSKS